MNHRVHKNGRLAEQPARSKTAKAKTPSGEPCMNLHTEFSVFMVSRPGVLTQVCRALAESKINIVALTMVDTMEHGVMRIICADAEKGRKTLQQANFTFTENTVLAIDMPNRPGAAADVAERLSAAKVQISYMYLSTAGAGSRAIGIFRVNSVAKAKKALANTKKTSRQMKIKRRPPTRR